MKKYMRVIDCITILAVILHIQSLIVFIIENYIEHFAFSFFDFLIFNQYYGIISSIRSPDIRYWLLRFIFLIYIANIVVFIDKIKAIQVEKGLSKKIYRYTIILNVLFIIFKTLEYINNSYFAHAYYPMNLENSIFDSNQLS